MSTLKKSVFKLINTVFFWKWFYNLSKDLKEKKNKLDFVLNDVGIPDLKQKSNLRLYHQICDPW